jgi:hypothetical protein
VIFVQVFQYIDGDWVQIGTTRHQYVKRGRSYPVALSSDGRVLGVGDPGRIVGDGVNAGHCHVERFDDATNDWKHIDRDVDGEDASDLFGFSIDLSADGFRLVVGIPFTRKQGFEAGEVQVFDLEEV